MENLPNETLSRFLTRLISIDIIFQFVQMRKYLPPHRALTEEDTLNAKTQLAKEVLYEVPAQLTSYMKSKGIYPRPPTSPFIDEIISRRGSIAREFCH